MYKLLSNMLLVLLFLFSFFSVSYGSNYSFIWNEDTTNTSSNITNDLSLESGSAILIEQTTRENFI